MLSIHVKDSPGESVGRLENRIMHWISETSTQFTESQAAVASPARPVSTKAAAADVLWPMRAAFDRLTTSNRRPSKLLSSTSPCEMFAIVFMFKAIPVLTIPDSSNSLTAPAMRSVRAFVLQYYDMCAPGGSSRKSVGSGAPTAGEGADALYLCLLSLLLQPGDADLQQRLGMSRLERRESDEAGAGDSEAPDAAPHSPPVDDIVVMLLSKLEPSGILDRCVARHYLLSTLASSSPIDVIRWPAFMCALFLRFLDALIISSQASLIMPHLISFTFDLWQHAVPPHLHSSQAVPLERSEADRSLHKIRNPDSLKYDGAAAMLLPAVDSTVSAASAVAGFNYEYESGLCIILRLLARFVDVAHKSASLSVPFTSSFITFIDSGGAPSAVDDAAAGVAGAGLASAMQVKHASRRALLQRMRAHTVPHRTHLSHATVFPRHFHVSAGLRQLAAVPRLPDLHPLQRPPCQGSGLEFVCESFMTQTPAFASASLFVPKMSAINLVKVIPEKEQERVRHALTVRCSAAQGAVCLSFI